MYQEQFSKSTKKHPVKAKNSQFTKPCQQPALLCLQNMKSPLGTGHMNLVVQREPIKDELIKIIQAQMKDCDKISSTILTDMDMDTLQLLARLAEHQMPATVLCYIIGIPGFHTPACLRAFYSILYGSVMLSTKSIETLATAKIFVSAPELLSVIPAWIQVLGDSSPVDSVIKILSGTLPESMKSPVIFMHFLTALSMIAERTSIQTLDDLSTAADVTPSLDFLDTFLNFITTLDINRKQVLPSRVIKLKISHESLMYITAIATELKSLHREAFLDKVFNIKEVSSNKTLLINLSACLCDSFVVENSDVWDALFPIVMESESQHLLPSLTLLIHNQIIRQDSSFFINIVKAAKVMASPTQMSTICQLISCKQVTEEALDILKNNITLLTELPILSNLISLLSTQRIESKLFTAILKNKFLVSNTERMTILTSLACTKPCIDCPDILMKLFSAEHLVESKENLFFLLCAAHKEAAIRNPALLLDVVQTPSKRFSEKLFQVFELQKTSFPAEPEGAPGKNVAMEPQTEDPLWLIKKLHALQVGATDVKQNLLHPISNAPELLQGFLQLAENVEGAAGAMFLISAIKYLNENRTTLFSLICLAKNSATLTSVTKILEYGPSPQTLQQLALFSSDLEIQKDPDLFVQILNLKPEVQLPLIWQCSQIMAKPEWPTLLAFFKKTPAFMESLEGISYLCTFLNLEMLSTAEKLMTVPDITSFIPEFPAIMRLAELQVVSDKPQLMELVIDCPDITKKPEILMQFYQLFINKTLSAEPELLEEIMRSSHIITNVDVLNAIIRIAQVEDVSQKYLKALMDLKENTNFLPFLGCFYSMIVSDAVKKYPAVLDTILSESRFIDDTDFLINVVTWMRIPAISRNADFFKDILDSHLLLDKANLSLFYQLAYSPAVFQKPEILDLVLKIPKEIMETHTTLLSTITQLSLSLIPADSLHSMLSADAGAHPYLALINLGIHSGFPDILANANATRLDFMKTWTKSESPTDFQKENLLFASVSEGNFGSFYFTGGRIRSPHSAGPTLSPAATGLKRYSVKSKEKKLYVR